MLLIHLRRQRGPRRAPLAGVGFITMGWAYAARASLPSPTHTTRARSRGLVHRRREAREPKRAMFVKARPPDGTRQGRDQGPAGRT
jgi:hypothetical protein